MAACKFRVVEPDSAPKEVTLDVGQTFGRDPKNNVVASDPAVGAFQFKIVQRPDGAVELEELGATNSTVAGGRKLVKDGRCPLSAGDKLKAGNTEITVLSVPARPSPVGAGDLGEQTVRISSGPRGPAMPRPPVGGGGPGPRGQAMAVSGPGAPTIPQSRSPTAGAAPGPALGDVTARAPGGARAPVAGPQPMGAAAPSARPAAVARGAVAPGAVTPAAVAPLPAAVTPASSDPASGHGPGGTQIVEDEAMVRKLRELRPRLVIRGGGGKRLVEIDAAVFSIGRQEGLNLVVSDSTVSGEHVEITFDGAEFSVQDKSSNGTVVGEERLRKGETTVITSDTALTMGRVEALFVCESSESATRGRKYGVQEDAALFLAKQRKISADERRQARQEALDRNYHVGEMLLLESNLSPKDWAGAVASVRSGAFRPGLLASLTPTQLLLVGVGVLAVVALALVVVVLIT